MKRFIRTLLAPAGSALLALTMSSCEMIPPVDPGGSDGPVKIGLIGPRGYENSFSRGAELALQEINAAGGVRGRMLEFAVRDNQGGDIFPTVESAVAAALDLVENEGVAAILGPVFSTNSIGLGNALTAANVKIPLLPGSVSPAITDVYSYTFLTAVNNHLSAQVLAEFALNGLNLQTVGVAVQAEDAYSRILREQFSAAFQAGGGTVTGSNSYEVGAVDFSAQIAELTADNPDALLLTSFAPEVPNFMKQARDMGYEGLFIGGDGWDDAARFYSTLDDNAPLNGSYFTSNFFAGEDPDANRFADAYTAAYGLAPDGLAATGYDAARILAQALEAADSLGPDDIRSAVHATQNYRGATAISRYDENRIAVKDLTILTIENGAPTFHSRWSSAEGERR